MSVSAERFLRLSNSQIVLVGNSLIVPVVVVVVVLGRGWRLRPNRG
jgi:hypothetical protein